MYVFPPPLRSLLHPTLLGHLCIFRGRQAKKLICKFRLWRKNIYNKLNLQPKRTELRIGSEPSWTETERESVPVLTKCSTNCVYAAWSPLDKWKCLLDFLSRLSPPWHSFCRHFWFDWPSFSCLPSKQSGEQEKNGWRMEESACNIINCNNAASQAWRPPASQPGLSPANSQPISALLKFFAWKTINRKQFYCCQHGPQQDQEQDQKKGAAHGTKGWGGGCARYRGWSADGC